MTDRRFHILIAGGGITGLTTAYYVKKLFSQKGIPIEITLVESSNHFGGKIQTISRDGFMIERGPDSFLARKTPIIDLTKDLGLEDELVGLNPKANKTYILKDGKLHRIPPGLVMGIPTQVTPFIKSGLISWPGKFRAAMDLLLPRRQGNEDESLGDFLDRRLGSEVLDHIAEPLLGGIYAGDTHHLSLQSTFPQFHHMENKYRSIILGMVRSRKQNKQNPKEQPSLQLPKSLSRSMFLTYRRGLITLVDRLVEQLEADEDVHLWTGKSVKGIHRNEENGYNVLINGGDEVRADGVILALPANVLSKLVSLFPGASEQLAKIQYISVANVILAFDQEEIDLPLDASGFVIPRSEGRKITACTWTSSKWLHTAPEGKVLLRCYIGRQGEMDWIHLTDDELVQLVREELKDIMQLEGNPLFTIVNRWEDAMPQYPVGHLDHIQQAQDELAARMPGVVVTGSAFRGVGLPDCIRQGKESAEQLVDMWEKQEKEL